MESILFMVKGLMSTTQNVVGSFITQSNVETDDMVLTCFLTSGDIWLDNMDLWSDSMR